MSARPGKRRFYTRPAFWVGMCIPALLLLYAGLLWYTVPSSPGQELTLAEYRQLDGKTIHSATLKSEDSRIELVQGPNRFWVALPSKNALIDNFLTDATVRGIPVRVDQQKLKQLVQPATFVVPALIVVAAFLLFYLLMKSSSNSPFLRAAARKGATDRPITFADVAGADEAVTEAREVRDYLANPKRFNDVGAEAPRGILFVGPPGTGKTLLARAVAGEADVAFFSMSGADFVEMYVGVGASRVRDLFQQVRERAPAILFIDELDALGRTRAGTATAGQEERDQTLNQLLVELDGFERDTGVVLIGATNRPDVLDPALLRRGRFDRQIVIDRPDQMGRLAILEVHAKNKPLGPDVDLAALATDTPGFTGADLASVMNEAALLTARRGRNVIAQQELDDAIQRILSGSEGRTTILSTEEKRAVAYHEAGHAIVAFALREAGAVRRISIVGRSRILGSTRVTPEGEKAVVGQRELEHRLAFMMGGRAADEIVLGQATTSSKTDLRLATDLARRMVCELGMSDSLGRRALGRPAGGGFLDGGDTEVDYSAEVAGEIDREIARLVDRAFEQASQVLLANTAIHAEMAELLVRRETLREADLVPFAARVSLPTGDGVAVGGRRVRAAGQVTPQPRR